MDRDSLANKLVRQILARIAAKEYPTDARIPSERALCEEFQISRGTVRQSLSILAELGVIEIRQGSGAYVRNFPQNNIPTCYLPPEISNVTLADILCVRKAIETTAAELACERLTSATVKELKNLIDRMEADQENLPAFLKHDMAFHETIIRCSGNCPLITAFEAVREYHRYFQVFTSRSAGDEQTAVEEHRRIFQAIRLRNREAAVRAVRKHLDGLIHVQKSNAMAVQRFFSKTGLPLVALVALLI